jgi:hypothetical protein
VSRDFQSWVFKINQSPRALINGLKPFRTWLEFAKIFDSEIAKAYVCKGVIEDSVVWLRPRKCHLRCHWDCWILFRGSHWNRWIRSRGLIEPAEAKFFRHNFMLKTTILRKNYNVEVFIRIPPSYWNCGSCSQSHWKLQSLFCCLIETAEFRAAVSLKSWKPFPQCTQSHWDCGSWLFQRIFPNF